MGWSPTEEAVLIFPNFSMQEWQINHSGSLKFTTVAPSSEEQTLQMNHNLHLEYFFFYHLLDGFFCSQTLHLDFALFAIYWMCFLPHRPHIPVSKLVVSESYDSYISRSYQVTKEIISECKGKGECRGGENQARQAGMWIPVFLTLGNEFPHLKHWKVLN